jgi:hypothetical protein
MPTYTLNLSISAQDLETIAAAGENIIVAKPVTNASGTPNVAWLSVPPLENNQITWVEDYAIYASTTEIASGAAIFQSSVTSFPAEDGVCYDFATSGAFGGPVTGPQPVPLGSFSTLNDFTSRSAMTFGLTQSANANGGLISLSPLNAQSVPEQQQAVFTPLTTVWVWLEANVRSATMITGVFSKVAVITFGGEVNTQGLTYAAAQGQFEPDDSSADVKLLDFRKYLPKSARAGR